MPFKSEAQRRKFASLVKEGKMKQSVFDEWNNATKGDLPERVKTKKPSTIKELKEIAKKKLNRA